VYLSCPLTLSMLNCSDSAKLIEIYRNRHNISASGGLSDPAVATGISDLMYASKEVHKEITTIQSGIDPDLAMAWAAGLEDDVWANNAPAVDKVSLFTYVIYLLTICSGTYYFLRKMTYFIQEATTQAVQLQHDKKNVFLLIDLYR
jgi:hypothetical protein